MRDRRNTFEVGEGLLYKGEEERIEQEEQYPEKRDFCFYGAILRMLSLFSSFR